MSAVVAHIANSRQQHNHHVKPITLKRHFTYPSMSGVSDISFRALVMYGSSADITAQELTHSAKYRAEITLDSISSTTTHY